VFIQYVSVFLVSFFLTVISVVVLKKLAVRFRFPLCQKIPLVGGIGIGLAFSISALYGFRILGKTTGYGTAILMASPVMLLFGLIDDIRELSVLSKFIAQIAAASVLLLYGVETHIIYIGCYLNVFITLIWVIGITNAFNLLDIGDGLAGGITLLVSISFACISFLNGDIQTLVLCLALSGASLGFLIFNFPPARVYMGNAGSHYAGFILAAIALIAKYATMERKIALLSPLLILGLPILDTAFLIIVRMSKKKVPFNKSDDHIYLRFLRLGYSKRKALFGMLGMCFIFSLGGILLSRVSSSYAAAILMAITVCMVFVLRGVARAPAKG
jgi:UDP-GlcNAc:undecaprenyl-phosphate GlcNAc-1-phosphate transferase